MENYKYLLIILIILNITPSISSTTSVSKTFKRVGNVPFSTYTDEEFATRMRTLVQGLS